MKRASVKLLGVLCVAVCATQSAMAGTALISGNDQDLYPQTDQLVTLNGVLWAADSFDLSTDGTDVFDYNGMDDGIGMADVIGSTTAGTLGAITYLLTGPVPAGGFMWFDISNTTAYDDPNRFCAVVLSATGVVIEYGTKADGNSCNSATLATVANPIGARLESVPADSKFVVSYTTDGDTWTPVDVTWASITATGCVGTVSASTALRVKGPASYGCDWSGGWPCAPFATVAVDEFKVVSEDIAGDFVFGQAEGGEGEGEGEGEVHEFNDACFYDKWEWFWSQYWSVADWAALTDLGAATTDADGAGVPDLYDVGIIAGGLAYDCTQGESFVGNPEIEAVFMANHNALLVTGQGPYWGQPVVLGMLATISQDWIDAIKAQYPGLAGVALAPYTGAKAAGEPLSAEGDFDGDGFANLDEYLMVENMDAPEPILYAKVAMIYYGGFFPGNPDLPVTGLLGLALLVSGIGAAGFRIVRNRK